MPKLDYETYYSEQMNFINRYIRNDQDPEDNKRLKRIKQKQAQQSIYFLDEFLDIEEGKELETTRIGYAPLTNVKYSKNQLLLAPDARLIKPENRRLSRSRLIYGPVDFYLDDQFDKPTEIPVITACAPNLMGSSAVDLQEFSKEENGVRTLKEDVYEKECKRLADFIVGTAKANNRTRLIMPAFGVGVYIKMLDGESKKVALELMYKAFAQAAAKHQIKVDWIVWAKAHQSKNTAKTLEGYAQNNPWMTPVVHTDMMLYAQELKNKGEDIVLVNPGSDRTIGGAYTTKDPHTLEEQIAQKSDLVFLHTEYNTAMVDSFKKEFSNRKKMRGKTSDTQPSSEIPSSAPKPDKQNFKSVAQAIRQKIKTIESPWITQSKNNYGISFKSTTEANALVAYLDSIQIKRKNGNSKTVQPVSEKGRNYSVLYLTQNEYSSLVGQLEVKPLQYSTIQHGFFVRKGPSTKWPVVTPESEMLPFKKVAPMIKNSVNLQEKPWIGASNNNQNYIVSFKDINAANTFVAYLDKINVRGKNDASKTVQNMTINHNSYSAIYLTKDQYKTLVTQVNAASLIPEIKDLIKTLQREVNSFWSLNKGRKGEKVKALQMLINESSNYNSAEELVNAVIKKYPEATKGFFSNRTGALIKEVKNASISKKP